MNLEFVPEFFKRVSEELYGDQKLEIDFAIEDAHCLVAIPTEAHLRTYEQLEQAVVKVLRNGIVNKEEQIEKTNTQKNLQCRTIATHYKRIL